MTDVGYPLKDLLVSLTPTAPTVTVVYISPLGKVRLQSSHVISPITPSPPSWSPSPAVRVPAVEHSHRVTHPWEDHSRVRGVSERSCLQFEKPVPSRP